MSNFQAGQFLVCVDDDDMGDLLVKGKVYQIIPYPERWPGDDLLEESDKVLVSHHSISIGGKPTPFYVHAYRFRVLEEDV